MPKDPDLPEPDEDEPDTEPDDDDTGVEDRSGVGGDPTPSAEAQPAREAQNVRSTGTTTPGGGPSTTRDTRQTPPTP